MQYEVQTYVAQEELILVEFNEGMYCVCTLYRGVALQPPAFMIQLELSASESHHVTGRPSTPANVT